MPADGAELLPPIGTAAPPPPFFVHLPPEAEENAAAIRAAIDAEPAAHLNALRAPLP